MVDMGLDTKTTTYELGNAGLDLRQTQIYAGLTRLMEYPGLWDLKYWMIESLTAINI
jgi:hypothetical protein